MLHSLMSASFEPTRRAAPPNAGPAYPHDALASLVAKTPAGAF